MDEIIAVEKMNRFCLKNCDFCKVKKDSRWVNMVFCEQPREVKNNSARRRICTRANLVEEGYS